MDPSSKNVILMQKTIAGQSRRDHRTDSMTVDQNLPNLNDSSYTSNLVGGTTQAPTPPDNNKMRINDECIQRQIRQDESEMAQS